MEDSSKQAAGYSPASRSARNSSSVAAPSRPGSMDADDAIRVRHRSGRSEHRSNPAMAPLRSPAGASVISLPDPQSHLRRRMENGMKSPQTLRGSFSAVSTATIATKYSFFQVFRDLQDYLADFLKKLQKIAKKNVIKILQFFCENRCFFAKFCKIFEDLAS